MTWSPSLFSHSPPFSPRLQHYEFFFGTWCQRSLGRSPWYFAPREEICYILKIRSKNLGPSSHRIFSNTVCLSVCPNDCVTFSVRNYAVLNGLVRPLLSVRQCVCPRHRKKKKAQLSLGMTRYSLCSSCCRRDHQGHLRSTIFITPERAYAISYKWLIMTMAFFVTVFEIRPVIA